MNTVNYKLALIASIGGLLFGYDTAVIAGAVQNLTAYFSLTPTETGWAVSCALAGCMIGGLFGKVLTDKLGRKKTLIITACLILISAIGTALPDNLTTFVIFRVIGGLGIGLASLAVPVYISEISAKEVRGKMTALYQLMIALGMLIVYIVNTGISEMSPSTEWAVSQSWRWMFGSESIPALIFFVLLFTIKESPRWLVKNNQEHEAAKVIRAVNGNEADAEQIVREIKASFNDEHSDDKSDSLFSKRNRKVSLIVIATAFIVNSVGVNAVLYYGNVLVQNIGIANAQTAFWQQIIVGVVFLLAAVFAVYKVEAYGRRPLLIIGSAGCAISILALAAMIYLGVQSPFMFVLILIYIMLFGACVGPIFWVMLPELSPNSIRDRLVSVSVLMVWFGNFQIAQTFPMMNDNPYLIETFNGSFPFIIYGIFAILYLVLTIKCIPETKGKSLEQISAEMRGEETNLTTANNYN
ncbi:sugar porter family MFS transporter [Photobacterium sagamiensis]|uniref:sugar porter family MFS transporter n=1 Tax=Photobacterium sagamiensis TaxID=2910241 RepID=UPI003D0E1821